MGTYTTYSLSESWGLTSPCDRNCVTHRKWCKPTKIRIAILSALFSGVLFPYLINIDRGQDVCPHRKLSVGLALLLGRDAGQRDVWDAGTNEGICGEVWRIHQQWNHEPISLCFLVIARDWRGHQFRDTLYTTVYIHKAAEAGQTLQILIHPSDSGGWMNLLIERINEMNEWIILQTQEDEWISSFILQTVEDEWGSGIFDQLQLLYVGTGCPEIVPKLIAPSIACCNKKTNSKLLMV